jgi:hypothetical protein
MSISRALDSNNDILVRNGRLAIVENSEEAVQHVRTRLQFYTAEWFLDLSAGTPWLQEIFVVPTNLNNIESIIKTRIVLTPGILKLSEFSTAAGNANLRGINISFKAETTYGSVVAEEIYINV